MALADGAKFKRYQGACPEKTIETNIGSNDRYNGFRGSIKRHFYVQKGRNRHRGGECRFRTQGIRQSNNPAQH